MTNNIFLIYKTESAQAQFFTVQATKAILQMVRIRSGDSFMQVQYSSCSCKQPCEKDISIVTPVNMIIIPKIYGRD